MTVEILIRVGMAVGVMLLGWGGARLGNRLLLKRASRNRMGLDGFAPGRPAILYFTTPQCQPCKTIQRPALARLAEITGGGVTVIRVDANDRPDLAEGWGVLSVPTTFLIDSSGEARGVNHGAASAEKLLGQLERIEGKGLEAATAGVNSQVEAPLHGSD